MRLSMEDLGRLCGLLAEYKKELEWKSDDGAPVDESPVDAAVRAKSLAKIDDALEVVKDDFTFRIYNPYGARL